MYNLILWYTIYISTAPTTLKVRLGDWNAAGATEPIRAQDFAVSRITTHPSFSNTNLKNDVAVLRLSNAVVLGTTPTITTACLPAIPFTGSRYNKYIIYNNLN